MQHTKRFYIMAVTVLLMLTVLAAIMVTKAAAAITLTPTFGAAGSSVTVAGTGFTASTSVGIGFGAEVAASGEATPAPTGSGTGPWTSKVAHVPIKPGSFTMHSDVSGVTSDYTDNGDGTLASTSTYFVSGTINYTSGVFSRVSTSDLTGYDIVQTASYTYYQYNLTSAAGVPTSASGTFTTSVTVPTVANGNYNITAIDSKGKINASTFTVGVIPEGLTIGVMVLTSSAATLVGSRYFRKRFSAGSS